MWQDLTLTTALICVIAALLAGFVDAVAGGGGLIQLPVLLMVFPQQSIAMVSGTNKSVSIVGTSGAAVTYAKRMSLNRRLIVPMALSAFVGSAIGASLITLVDRSSFEPVLLAVLLVVSVFTMLRPDFGTLSRHTQRGPVAASLLGASIGFYDGIMGPGTGMFLVLGLIAVIGCNFLESSAMAKFVNVATNLAALAVFVPSHNVMWAVTMLMAPANLLGGLLGARTAINRGNVFVRAIFIAVQVAMVVRLFMAVR
jgi:uncharacterized membrane protein YfcA